MLALFAQQMIAGNMREAREREKSGESERQEVLLDLRRDEKNAGGSGQRAPLGTGRLGRTFLRCRFDFSCFTVPLRNTYWKCKVQYVLAYVCTHIKYN